ncbi:MAG: class I SAM-dependent methyltransferase [Candidatus Mariimomonas ferrooxydans]
MINKFLAKASKTCIFKGYPGVPEACTPGQSGNKVLPVIFFCSSSVHLTLTLNRYWTYTGLTMTELYRGEGLEIYEKSHYSHGEHIDEVEQILSWYSPCNARILDIGCSAGLHALEFAKRGFSITGLDIEPSAIELAKKRNKTGNLNAEFIVGDIEEFYFSSLGKFDFIYSIGNVLSHVTKDNIQGVLKKIKDCLRVSGIFLFNVLIISKSYKEEIFSEDNDLKIIWKRKIDEKTGHIDLERLSEKYITFTKFTKSHINNYFST